MRGGKVTHTTFGQAVDEMITRAEESYRSQAGDASFCQVQKDGRVTGGMKYEEGRLVALHWIQRKAAAYREEGTAAYAAAVGAERQAWLAALAAVQAKTPPAVTWIAYRQGGVDALTWALEVLQRPSG